MSSGFGRKIKLFFFTFSLDKLCGMWYNKNSRPRRIRGSTPQDFCPNFRTYVRQFPQTKEENSFALLSSFGKKGIFLVKKCLKHFHNFAFSVGIFAPVSSIWLFIIEQYIFCIELKPFFWCSVWHYCNFIKLYTWQMAI